jgi:hypothetical protein
MKITLVSVFLVCFGYLGSHAQNYQTYTLYINGLAKFVLWPEEDKVGDFEIYVLGESPLLGELQKMAEKKKLGDRSIKIVSIKSMDEFKKGHMIFLPSTQSGKLQEVIAKVGTLSTLIITEHPGLGAKGSDVNFIMKDGKLTFELNQASLAKRKLKAATELTRLAILI